MPVTINSRKEGLLFNDTVEGTLLKVEGNTRGRVRLVDAGGKILARGRLTESRGDDAGTPTRVTKFVPRAGSQMVEPIVVSEKVLTAHRARGSRRNG